LRHLYIKTNLLPRQARDKHRENSKKERPFFIRFRKPNVYAAVRRRKQHKTHTHTHTDVMSCSRLLQRSGSASFIPWVLMIYYLRLSRGELSRPTGCLGKSPCVRPESSHQKVSCCFASCFASSGHCGGAQATGTPLQCMVPGALPAGKTTSVFLAYRQLSTRNTTIDLPRQARDKRKHDIRV
jgi:hypothetical protein